MGITKQYNLGSQGSDSPNLWEILNKTGGAVGAAVQSAIKGGFNNVPKGATNTTKTGFTYDDYIESDTVKQANAALQAHNAVKPGDFTYKWQDHKDDTINKFLNREKFSYDVNSDALYQQYKEQYQSLGKLAMQDTMGQAAAMTGGYGSSYASSAGNQAYQQYLSQLNEVVPELYGMALDRYNAEGQELYNQYAMLRDLESFEYGKYRDSVSDWMTERDYLTGRYDTERGFDYTDHRNAIADEQWQKDFDEGVRQFDTTMDYQKDRDKVTDSQWQQSHQLSVNADDRAQAEYEDSTKSYSGTTADGKKFNNGSLTNGQIKELQAAIGVDADGYYGDKEKEAADGLSAREAYERFVGKLGDDEGGDDDGDDPDEEPNFALFGEKGWTDYFAAIRASEGKAAAEKELEDLIKAGTIPPVMLNAAKIGIWGSERGPI